jgi:hypothetical protein
MVAAPLLIAATSRPLRGGLFQVPERNDTPEVYGRYLDVIDGWTEDQPSRIESPAHVAA